MITIRGCGRCFFLFALVVLLSGCGSSSTTVQGTVTLDGTPVEKGLIAFVPIEGTSGSGARVPIKDGHYAIERASRIVPGLYRVEISSSRKTGKQVPVGSSPFVKVTTGEEEVEAVPVRYNKRSTLKQELKAGSNTADFTLTTKG